MRTNERPVTRLFVDLGGRLVMVLRRHRRREGQRETRGGPVEASYYGGRLGAADLACLHGELRAARSSRYGY